MKKSGSAMVYCWSILMITTILLAWPPVLSAGENNLPQIEHSAPSVLPYPEILDLYVTIDTPVTVVKLYFLKPGFSDYQLRIMKKSAKKGSYKFSLDTSMLTSPQLSYYIEAITETGPIRFPVDAPDDVITLRGNPEDAVAGVDLPLLPPSPVAGEDRTLTSGWPVQMDLDSVSKWEVESSGKAGSPLKQDKRLITDNNLRLSTSYRKDDFGVSFSSNLAVSNHVQPDMDEVSLTNVLLEMDYKNHRFSLGDIDVQGSQLTLDTSRRGAGYSFETPSFMIRVFDINSQQNDNWDHAVPDSGNNLYGGMVGFNLGENLFSFKTIFVSGKDDPAESRNSEGVSSEGREGWVLSFLPRLNLFDNRLSLFGEYALGNYDGDLSDDAGENKDDAWRAGVTFTRDWLELGADYYHINKDFNSIGNFYSSLFTSDRKGYTLSGGVTLPWAKLTASFAGEEDNVEDDPAKETSSIDTFQAGVTLYPSENYTVTAGYRQEDQETVEAGGTGARLKEDETRNYSLRLDFLLTKVSNIFFAGEYSLITSTTDADVENNTLTGSLGGVFRFGECLSLLPEISYSETDYDNSDEASKTFSAFLDAELFLVPRTLSIATLSSYNKTEIKTPGSGGATDTEDIQVTLKLNYHITSHSDFLKQAVISLNGQWARSVENDVEEDNHSVVLQLEFAL